MVRGAEQMMIRASMQPCLWQPSVARSLRMIRGATPRYRPSLMTWSRTATSIAIGTMRALSGMPKVRFSCAAS